MQMVGLGWLRCWVKVSRLPHNKVPGVAVMNLRRGLLNQLIMNPEAPVSTKRAMEVAIKKTYPGTVHRWCTKETLGPLYMKKSDFRAEFYKVVNHMLTEEEFESTWGAVLDKNNLRSHTYMTQIYETRRKWAKPYFRGMFCANMTSTQRSESANHMLKLYMPPASLMHVFVRQ